MRLFKLISWLVTCGMIAVSATIVSGQQPARVPGRIIAVKVTGSVTATNQTDHSQTKLANNDKLSEHYVVTTGAGSSAILVFSNGATLNLGADSTLSIDEFLQDPFDSQIVVGNISEEPTTSTTKLNLSRGELVGNVKHLHQDKGSTFTVNTPVGAAGIRGTTFRIVFRPDANGNITFTLSTADGSVSFQGATTGAAAAGVHVDTGKEISLTVEATVNSDGTITITSPPVIDATTTTQRDIPPETQTAIQNSAQQIVEASSPVILNALGGDTGNNPSNNPNNDPNQQKKETKGPDQETNQSDTTPGAGAKT